MIQKPTISLHAPGVDVVLSNRAGRFVLMQGATGLGVAPRDLTVSDLPRGGGVLRHARSAVPRVTIPILLGGDYGERAEDRRTLERLSEGYVEIRVTQPDGESRSRTGVYVDGLDGDYGAGEDSPDGQKLVLTFDCPDFRWFGPQREESWSLSPKRTAWLSRMRDEPSVPRLVRSNFMLNPALDSDVGWVPSQNPEWVDASVSSEKTLFGTSARRLETLVPWTSATQTGHSTHVAVLETGASGPIRYRAGVWVWVDAPANEVRVFIQSDSSGEWVTTGSTVLRSGDVQGQWTQVVVEEQSASGGSRRVRVEVANRHFMGAAISLPVGSVSYVGAAVLTDAQSPVDYWDGDSDVPGYAASWEGAPHASVSHLHTIPAPAEGVLAVPFGTMRLSESTVQGSRQVEIAGDADAEAVLIIDGPGEDLEVVNETTAQRIFITGDIDETLTIDSRGGWQDIYSDSMRDGEWWARVNEDAPEELITLAPGQNLIRVTMVNAHPQSKVRLLYRETYRAGH